jgi:serine/threonine protein phosphatase PrpC
MNSSLFEMCSISLRGNRRSNQDRYCLLENSDTAFLVVADGMGGHPKGEEAAAIATEVCCDLFMRERKPIHDPEAFLQKAARHAHAKIVEFGESHSPRLDPRTTLVLSLVQNGMAWWGHIGDSRLYHFRENRILSRTRDHSFVERLLQNGSITEAETMTSSYRNYVTRCLGGYSGQPELCVDNAVVQLDRGDILLLCSDGLWGPLGDERLAKAFHGDLALESILQRTADMAFGLSMPKSDNITAVALRWLFRGTLTPRQPEVEGLGSAVDHIKSVLATFDAERTLPGFRRLGTKK